MAETNFVVTARIKAKPGSEDRVRYVLKALIGPTRKEEGCLSYNWHESQEEYGLFMSYEVWKSKDVFLKHLETPYIKAMQDLGADILAEPLGVTMLDTLS